MKRFALILLLSFAVLSACQLNSTTSQVSGFVSPPNALAMGGADDGIVVDFIEVLNDSRCAEGVECVTAGKADLKLGITIDSGDRNEVTLEFVPGSGAEYETGDYTIKARQLFPDPPPVGGVEQSDYQLELAITKS